MSKSAPIAQSGIGQLGGYATNESGSGLFARNLAYVRISFLLYGQRSSILQTAIAKYSAGKKVQTVSAILPPGEKSQTQSGQALIFQPAIGKSAIPQTAVHAREYKRYLPSKEELRLKPEEWAREVGDE